jgi:hypothetical protein
VIKIVKSVGIPFPLGQIADSRSADYGARQHLRLSVFICG